LEVNEGYLSVSLQRAALIEDLTDSELLDLEETIGAMEAVFEEAFGFGDFVRWMPLGKERLVAQLFPIGAYAGKNEVDVALKVRLMLQTLKGRAGLAPALLEEQVEKIRTAANRILSQQNEPVPHLEDVVLPYRGVKEAFALLVEENGREEKWLGGYPSSRDFSTKCKVFCNPQIIQKQFVFEGKENHALYNMGSFALQHLLVIPKRHITAPLEHSSIEILEKYRLFQQFDAIVKEHFGSPETAVLTRVGWRSGQTQSHLHDHLIGFDPHAPQNWTRRWAYELSRGSLIEQDPVQWEEERRALEEFFRG
jgi:diadenosine tetraphosphate (Ap4A) HIT family hydrolase